MSRVAGMTGLALMVLTAMGCVAGKTSLEGASLLRTQVTQLGEDGARNCAPRSYAMAVSHLDFSDQELDRGDFLRAAKHLEVASEGVRTAEPKVDPETCRDKPKDGDQDGIADDVDRCPMQPEDFDGYEDENGCPDLDNDADTILDVDDKCPLEAGVAENHGCPVRDRDGDGIADDVDRCPDTPEDMDGDRDEDGCPDAGDRDGDGRMDDVDNCPDDPEDIDDFEDTDGCPDTDNDADGLADVDDRCPLQSGPAEWAGCPSADRDADGVQDDVDACPDVPGSAPRGCPKRLLVERTKTDIKIREQIRFESGRAVITARISVEVLDQVAAVLVSNPELRVNIEGHTDSVGEAAFNLRLSDDRSRAVLTALVERGIAASRLDAIGYGEVKPIESNRTRRGRAKNRRVEFKILPVSPPGSSE